MPPDKVYNVAVVGATGVVGQQFLQTLGSRHFPLRNLKLFASKRSAGRRITFGERQIEVQEATPKSFAGADFVFISATDEVSRHLAPAAAKAGAIAIDDSGVWRMEPNVPLVVPEVNADDVAHHEGILSIPNCQTTPLVMALWPIHRVNPIERVILATYQSVSGTGQAAVHELAEQTKRLLQNQRAAPHVYPHQIAHNVLPEIGSFKDDGYTSEEWKMTAETRKIMHEPELLLSATCVRVPVYVGHSAAVHVELSRQMDPEEAAGILRDAPGVVVQDDPAINLYPQPWTAAGRDEVFVGRIRHDSSRPRGLVFWVVCDNLRKGAALNALQIAEEMINRGLV
ncbi:MAG: aspartate-semialdehyde dehydrogenase [Dehalococcoidia bacterium]|nr:aspartate-semialdehyde dehydrogenase [Dehalococcoidia bacterium]